MTGTSLGPPWYSVAGGAPTFSGSVRVTTGPLASPNGLNNATQFQRTWSYTGRVLSADVDINRAEPAAGKCETLRWGENVSRSHGHLIVPLPGVGDYAIAIFDHAQKGAAHPLVRANACSGNARFSVLLPIDGVITNEADLSEHTAVLVAALDELLGNLRPR